MFSDIGNSSIWKYQKQQNNLIKVSEMTKKLSQHVFNSFSKHWTLLSVYNWDLTKAITSFAKRQASIVLVALISWHLIKLECANASGSRALTFYTAWI